MASMWNESQLQELLRRWQQLENELATTDAESADDLDERLDHLEADLREALAQRPETPQGRTAPQPLRSGAGEGLVSLNDLLRRTVGVPVHQARAVRRRLERLWGSLDDTGRDRVRQHVTRFFVTTSELIRKELGDEAWVQLVRVWQEAFRGSELVRNVPLGRMHSEAARLQRQASELAAERSEAALVAEEEVEEEEERKAPAAAGLQAEQAPVAEADVAEAADPFRGRVDERFIADIERRFNHLTASQPRAIADVERMLGRLNEFVGVVESRFLQNFQLTGLRTLLSALDFSNRFFDFDRRFSMLESIWPLGLDTSSSLFGGLNMGFRELKILQGMGLPRVELMDVVSPDAQEGPGAGFGFGGAGFSAGLGGFGGGMALTSMGGVRGAAGMQVSGGGSLRLPDGSLLNASDLKRLEYGSVGGASGSNAALMAAFAADPHLAAVLGPALNLGSADFARALGREFRGWQPSSGNATHLHLGMQSHMLGRMPGGMPAGMRGWSSYGGPHVGPMAFGPGGASYAGRGHSWGASAYRTPSHGGFSSAGFAGAGGGGWGALPGFSPSRLSAQGMPRSGGRLPGLTVGGGRGGFAVPQAASSLGFRGLPGAPRSHYGGGGLGAAAGGRFQLNNVSGYWPTGLKTYFGTMSGPEQAALGFNFGGGSNYSSFRSGGSYHGGPSLSSPGFTSSGARVPGFSLPSGPSMQGGWSGSMRRPGWGNQPARFAGHHSGFNLPGNFHMQGYTPAPVRFAQASGRRSGLAPLSVEGFRFPQGGRFAGSSRAGYGNLGFQGTPGHGLGLGPVQGVGFQLPAHGPGMFNMLGNRVPDLRLDGFQRPHSGSVSMAAFHGRPGQAGFAPMTPSFGFANSGFRSLGGLQAAGARYGSWQSGQFPAPAWSGSRASFSQTAGGWPSFRDLALAQPGGLHTQGFSSTGVASGLQNHSPWGFSPRMGGQSARFAQGAGYRAGLGFQPGGFAGPMPMGMPQYMASMDRYATSGPGMRPMAFADGRRAGTDGVLGRTDYRLSGLGLRSPQTGAGFGPGAWSFGAQLPEMYQPTRVRLAPGQQGRPYMPTGAGSLGLRQGQGVNLRGLPGLRPDQLSGMQLPRGTGQRLTPDMEQTVQPILGRQLQDVRIHRGPQVDRLAWQVGAPAFTVGRDVYVSSAAGDFLTPRGRQVLGHELSHAASPVSELRRFGDAPSVQGEGLAVAQGRQIGRLRPPAMDSVLAYLPERLGFQFNESHNVALNPSQHNIAFQGRRAPLGVDVQSRRQVGIQAEHGVFDVQVPGGIHKAPSTLHVRIPNDRKGHVPSYFSAGYGQLPHGLRSDFQLRSSTPLELRGMWFQPHPGMRGTGIQKPLRIQALVDKWDPAQLLMGGQLQGEMGDQLRFTGSPASVGLQNQVGGGDFRAEIQAGPRSAALRARGHFPASVNLTDQLAQAGPGIRMERSRSGATGAAGLMGQVSTWNQSMISQAEARLRSDTGVPPRLKGSVLDFGALSGVGEGEQVDVPAALQVRFKRPGGPAMTTVPAGGPFHRALARSHGRPLAGRQLNMMQSVMGRHPMLSQVRVHDDQAAQGLVHSQGADAFTIGRDIYLKPAAGSPERTLPVLGHEVVHATGGAGRVAPARRRTAAPEERVARRVEKALRGVIGGKKKRKRDQGMALPRIAMPHVDMGAGVAQAKGAAGFEVSAGIWAGAGGCLPQAPQQQDKERPEDKDIPLSQDEAISPLVHQVYERICRQLQIERERKGGF